MPDPPARPDTAPQPPLLAVPNVSEGRDAQAIEAIATAFARRANLLDVHSDRDHHRSVVSLAGPAGTLAEAVLEGARETIAGVDLSHPRGAHPHVGALDVAPVVHLRPDQRGAACAEALKLADLLAVELALPVFLYGALAGGRTRAEIRRGGLAGLAGRMQTGELRPDFGPRRPHPTAGATLVAARPPLVAFNLELAPPADLQTARQIAAAVRDGGSHGLPGLRAIAVALTDPTRAQVSMNVEDPFALALGEVVAAVAAHAPVASAELVGLAPQAALAGFPEEVPMPGFDPARQVIENALGF